MGKAEAGDLLSRAARSAIWRHFIHMCGAKDHIFHRLRNNPHALHEQNNASSSPVANCFTEADRMGMCLA